MVDRYGNTRRSMRGFHHREHTDERLGDGGEGGEMLAGWTIAGVQYPEIGAFSDRSRPARANQVVTRPAGYVPYQSVFSPFGDHAYNPGARQYPQLWYDEVASGRIAETPTDRFVAQQAWPPQLTHDPNIPVEMRVAGIDYRDAPPYRDPLPWRPAPRTPPVPTGYGMPPPPRPAAMQNQYPYGTVPGGNRGQQGYGYGGTQPGPWDGYASARNNNQGWGGGYGSGGGGYW
jgi:hypothetical protein